MIVMVINELNDQMEREYREAHELRKKTLGEAILQAMSDNAFDIDFRMYFRAPESPPEEYLVDTIVEAVLRLDESK